MTSRRPQASTRVPERSRRGEASRRGGPSRGGGLIAKLGLAAASVVLCLVVLEGVLRVLEPKQPPGTTYGRPVSRNADGLRDRDFEKPKPAGVTRVLVLGDSFTWGVGLDVEETVPKLLERGLAAAGGGRVEVVNAAIPGHNTVQQLLHLRDVGLAYEPDLVLLIYNLNDIEYLPHLAEEGAGEPSGEIVPVVEIDPGEEVTEYSRDRGVRGMILAVERRSALTRFLVPRVGSLLRRAGLIQSVEFSWVAKIFQGFTDDNPGWRESKRALAAIAEEGRAGGFRVVVAVYPLFSDLEDYQGRAAHSAVLDHCAAAGIRGVDLLPLFENTRARSHWINYMDAHPDARAHRRVAELLLPVVAEELAKIPGAGGTEAP